MLAANRRTPMKWWLLLSLMGVGATFLSACTQVPQPGTTIAEPLTTEQSSSTATPQTTVISTTVVPWQPPAHPIQIADGAFLDTRTGLPFVVRGANYLTRVPVAGGYQDRTFSPSVFDRETVASDFAELARRGYNTVRIFIDTCNGGSSCIADPMGSGLNGSYLDVMVELMDLAKKYGLFLLLTSNDLPDDAGYWELSSRDDAGVYPGYRNSNYMTPSGEESAALYWNDLLSGLVERRAPFDVVLGWSILNEQWMFKDQYPLASDSGIVETKTGTYDTSDPRDRRKMVVDGLRGYIKTVAGVIRKHDPNGLVTMGFFAPQFPNATGIGGDWYVDTAPLVESSELDFFDFHAYPGEDISLELIAENFGLPAEKPVIMGEVGAFIQRYPDIERAAMNVQRWIAASCDLGFDGWLYWELLPADPSVGDATWALTAENNYLLDTLSPVDQPDPCTPTLEDSNLAFGASATASRSLDDETPGLAVDSDPTTQWGSGSDAPQWIEIDLGVPTEIGVLRMLVAQWPEGETRHVITIDGVEVAVLDGATAGGDRLEVLLDAPATGRFIRFTTTNSPSWVSWSEIEILAP